MVWHDQVPNKMTKRRGNIGCKIQAFSLSIGDVASQRLEAGGESLLPACANQD